MKEYGFQKMGNQKNINRKYLQIRKVRKYLIIFTIALTVIISCDQVSKSTQKVVAVEKEEIELTENEISKKQQTLYYENFIDTKYEYIDSSGNKLTILNSLPKGGLKYTDTKGNDYVYAIFWTHISNETGDSVELSINFPADSFILPSSSDTYFKVFLTSETMTFDKESLFNYGLSDLESVLGNGLYKPSSLQKTITPNGSSMFYVISLFNQGLDGVVRAGLSIKERDLFYRINDKEILCGKVSLYN